MSVIYPHPIPIPVGTERIVIFSNVKDGFSVGMAGLKSGDLCLHLNRAVHAEEAMKVEGTKHILIVRHGRGGLDKWQWYAPKSFVGYEHVLFTPIYGSFAELPWWEEYMAETGGRMPSTGFLAFKIAMTEAPDKPIVLAGFDPGVDHGTPLYAGHAWGYEASQYKASRVKMVLPKFNKVLTKNK